MGKINFYSLTVTKSGTRKAISYIKENLLFNLDFFIKNEAH